MGISECQEMCDIRKNLYFYFFFYGVLCYMSIFFGVFNYMWFSINQVYVFLFCIQVSDDVNLKVFLLVDL